ncbi:helix-turn-helix domain-containing protein [Kitasatospora purpeofusca]|uniref:helix-turn-helix domain-containing protein n=1 Tax=Kitasatospora purpeofusca TaxID=67352 RepID=UPI0036D37D6F
MTIRPVSGASQTVEHRAVHIPPMSISVPPIAAGLVQRSRWMLGRMPPTPSARRQRVGIELRKMRDAAGTTTAEASTVLGVDRTKITLIEQALYAVTPDRVAALARKYGETDDAFVSALATMAGDRSKGWWEEYRGAVPLGFLDLAEHEYYAKATQSYQICHPPGPMQSERYSRAIFRDAQPPLTPRIVETRVEHRMRRAEILMSEGAAPYAAIVHEAALRMQFGGREVLREQLNWMLELSERSHITLRVISFDAGGFKGSGQALIYMNGPVPRLDTVQYDTVEGPTFLHTTEHLERYRGLMKVMTERSLSVDGSRDLISKIKKEL